MATVKRIIRQPCRQLIKQRDATLAEADRLDQAIALLLVTGRRGPGKAAWAPRARKTPGPGTPGA